MTPAITPAVTPAAPLGSMNHLGITVSDLAGAGRCFYAPLLGFLGYSEVERQPEMALWVAPGGYAVNLWQAREEHRGKAVDRYAPGFHHFAFNAPAVYDYLPGYYAVFFADPDGLKFELVFIPPEALAAAMVQSALRPI
ncbi:MAG: hypothetical protein RH942_04885 [Kiloniellaceae bacterium]